MLPMLGTIDTRQHENVFLSVYRLLAIIRETLFYSKNNGSDSLEEMLSKEAPYSNFLATLLLGSGEPERRIGQLERCHHRYKGGRFVDYCY